MRAMHQSLFMGILNVTPDSFSDGGRFATTDSAVQWGKFLVESGANLIDVGGESTRPGADSVSVDEELRRVIPVLEKLKAQTRALLSIDTSKFEVAVQAVRAGAEVINDITGVSDIRIAELVRDKKLTICVMHMQKTPKDMQVSPYYAQGVVVEVKKFLEQKVRQLCEMGVPREKIWVDPGFGFGKTVQHNLDLLRHIKTFDGIGGRLLVGTSRKSFLGKLEPTKECPVADRESGTISSNLWAYSQGASVFRVHDVLSVKRAFQTWDAIQVGLFV